MGCGRHTHERVTRSTPALGASLALIAALVVACAAGPLTPTTGVTAPAPETPAPVSGPAPVRTVVISVGAVRFVGEIADTPEARTLGLSFRDSMQPGEAMWFDFGASLQTAFWMRGMRFPLDIVWVDEDLRVVHVTANAPPPAPGTPESALPLYRPGAPVRYVLEINAGLAASYSIVPGVAVRVSAGQ